MKKYGNDYRFWIESTVADTYNEVKGQTSNKVSRQSASFDTSSKDDGQYGTEGQGQRKVSMDLEILPNLPDVTGYTRLETLATGSAPVKVQIRKGGSAGATGDVVFAASMNIGNFDTDFPKDGAVKCTFQMSLASPPTTDLLS